MSDPQYDAAQWRSASAQLVAMASVVDARLAGATVPPRSLAGGFALATTTVIERCEKVLTRIGQHHASDLPEDTMDAMRTAVRHMRAARAALADVVPVLDPDGRGIY